MCKLFIKKATDYLQYIVRGQNSEVGGQRSEVRSQKSEVKSQKFLAADRPEKGSLIEPSGNALN